MDLVNLMLHLGGSCDRGRFGCWLWTNPRFVVANGSGIEVAAKTTYIRQRHAGRGQAFSNEGISLLEYFSSPPPTVLFDIFVPSQARRSYLFCCPRGYFLPIRGCALPLARTLLTPYSFTRALIPREIKLDMNQSTGDS